MIHAKTRISAVLVLLVSILSVLSVWAESPLTDGGDYIVQPGDTLASIAERFLGKADLYMQIVTATAERRVSDGAYAEITDPGRIEVGWRLFLAGVTAETPSMMGSDVGRAAVPEVQVASGEEKADIARGKIAFSLYNPGREVYEVQIVSVDGKERWIVTDEQSVSEPALSPDGTRVAVRGWDRYRGIQSFDLYGKDQAGVSGQHEDSKPDWGDNGNIVFGSQRESDRRWRLYVDGSGKEIKFTNEDNLVESLIGEDPAWSPGQRYIVYRGCDFDLNRCGLRTVWHQGAVPEILTIEQSDTSPDWSPDGKMILFMSARSGNWDLYTLAVDGQGRLVAGAEPVQITSDPSNEMLPVWSPWGDAVAFVSDRSGVWAIYVMRLDGSDLRKVVDIGGAYDPPLWSPEYSGRGVTNEQISWSK